MKPELIINADDFGMNENVTRAIARCFRNGLLSNTTMIVNMDYCEEALEIARREGFVKQVGLHLNLMQGVPLTEKMRMNRTFCNEDGMFMGAVGKGIRRYERFWLSHDDLVAVDGEIGAQMSRFKELGLSLMHCDAHQYSNTYLPILPVFSENARRFGFRTTRGSVWTSNIRGGRISFLKRMYAKHVRKRIVDMGLVAADVVGFLWNIDTLQLVEQCVVELHCHPNYRMANGELSLLGSLCDWTTRYEESFGLIKKNVQRYSLIDFTYLTRRVCGK